MKTFDNVFAEGRISMVIIVISVVVCDVVVIHVAVADRPGVSYDAPNVLAEGAAADLDHGDVLQGLRWTAALVIQKT